MGIPEKYGTWWVLQRPNPGARLKVFCFPYAGGNGYLFRSWHAALPQQVEVYGVQLPGRGNRSGEPLAVRASSLVPQLAAGLEPLLKENFVFFGYSMGAILSFELAKYLQSAGLTSPAHLFVAARRAPHIKESDAPTYSLRDEEFIEELKRLNGTPQEVLQNKELLDLVIPLLRADFELCQTYECSNGNPLACPITAFGGIDDKDTAGERLDGWQLQTTSLFTKQLFSGGHFFIHSNEAALLQSLNAALLRIIYARSYL